LDQVKTAALALIDLPYILAQTEPLPQLLKFSSQAESALDEV